MWNNIQDKIKLLVKTFHNMKYTDKFWDNVKIYKGNNCYIIGDLPKKGCMYNVIEINSMDEFNKLIDKYLPERTFKDYLIEQFQNDECVEIFLNTALEEFEEDKNVETFIHALKTVSEIRTDLSKFVKNMK